MEPELKQRVNKRSGSFNILIVDDNQGFRNDLVYFIESLQNFKIIGQAGNGQEAIALNEKLHPDVILMDISMPGMNGLEAVRRIKRRFPQIKIIIVSIHEADILQALPDTQLVDGFVSKRALKGELPKVLEQIKGGMNDET